MAVAPQDVVRRIESQRVLAIVRLDSGDALVEVAQALAAGGIEVLEYTMTTPGALRAIEQAAAKLGSRILVGAGTVLDVETARAAVAAGATFIVMPALQPDVVAECRRRRVPVIPGALSPTEILTAWQSGADFVKVFPASTVGPDYLRQVRQPLPQVKLIPTGGISAANAAAFLRAGAVAVGVGGNLVERKAVAEGRFELLTQRARELVQAVRDARHTT